VTRKLDQLEGRHPVLEALKAGRPLHEILIARETKPAKIVEDIVRLARRRGVAVRELPRRQLDERAQSRAPQGVIALVPPFSYTAIDEMLEAANGNGDVPLLIALDGVTDPQNVGALARSALAAGAHGVILRERRSAPITPAAEKAAGGALAHLPVAQVSNLERSLGQLKEDGVWIVALDADADTSIYETDIVEAPVCVVVGSEGVGVSHLIRKRSDFTVKIPMHQKMGSLNAATAGAIALFEIRRRRGEGSTR
jgi:23S rRNA (guanosine2251-2'-O)-methyltransferase